MHVSLQQTLTPSALARQSVAPFFRALMDAMIGIVQKWTSIPGIHQAGWAV